MDWIYLVSVDDVQGYTIIGTGKTPKEAMDVAWKAYKENFSMDFTDKKKWFEYHGISENSCKGFNVGDGWVW